MGAHTVALTFLLHSKREQAPLHRVIHVSETRRDIQMLRGLAVAAVVLNHFGGLLPGGFLGVDLFFAISGYVIFQSLARQLEGGPNPRLLLVEFWKRRFWRLVPALSVVLLFTALASFALLTPKDFRDQLEMIAWSTIFAGNIGVELVSQVDYFDPAADQNWLLHLWSLGVEEQFYLVFPILVTMIFALSRRTFFLRRMFATLSTMILLSLIVASMNELYFASAGANVQLAGDGLSAAVGYYSPATRAWEFGLGALAALIRPHVKTTSTPIALGGLAVIAICLSIFPESNLHPGPLALLPMAGAFAVLLSSPDQIPEDNPGARALRWIGDRSYSLYLWHWPIWSILDQFSDWPILVKILVAGALTTGLADRTFIHVEQRFRRQTPSRNTLKVSLPRRLTLTIVFLIGPLTVAAGLQLLFSSLAQGGRLPVATAVSQVEPEIDCLQRSCTEKKVEVFLVGDSHAGAIANKLHDELEQEGISMKAAVLNRRFGCLHLPSTSVVSIHEECRQLSAQVRDTIESVRPKVIVIYGYTAGRFTETNSGKTKEIEIRYEGESDVISADETISAYGVALREVINFATSRGAEVVIVSGTPDFDSRPEEVDNNGKKASAGRLILSSLGPPLLGMTVPLADQLERHGPFQDVENRFAQDFESVSVVDSWSVLCSEQSCAQANVNGDFLYSDHDHLSPEGASVLVPIIRDVVESLLIG